jgi:hypothetical protein
LSENGDHPYEDLAKFGYKLNMKAKKFKNPSIFLATSLILDTCIKIWRFFFIFGRILGIENLNNHLILALLILLPLFWIYIAQLFFFLGETIFALWRQKKSEFFGEKNNVHSKKIAKLLKLQNWKGFRKKKKPPPIYSQKKKGKKKKKACKSASTNGPRARSTAIQNRIPRICFRQRSAELSQSPASVVDLLPFAWIFDSLVVWFFGFPNCACEA